MTNRQVHTNNDKKPTMPDTVEYAKRQQVPATNEKKKSN